VPFTTDYTRNAIVHHGHFSKPYLLTDLSAKVCALLDG
jgi:hypothetical protein